jgi:hypothetical protein
LLLLPALLLLNTLLLLTTLLLIIKVGIVVPQPLLPVLVVSPLGAKNVTEVLYKHAITPQAQKQRFCAFGKFEIVDRNYKTFS